MLRGSVRVLLFFWMGTWILAGCTPTAVRPTTGEAALEQLEVLPMISDQDLARRIGQFAPTRIEYDPSQLASGEQAAVEHLLAAARILDDLFWHQASAIGPQLRERFAQPRTEREHQLATLLAIHYGPYDRLQEFQPFMEARDANGERVLPKPLGATYYPPDMTRSEFEAHLQAHPGDRPAFESNFTTIRRRAGALVAVPYSEEYGTELRQAADHLRRAADLVPSESLARFLRSRAEAFLRNDYQPSDMDWMDVKGSALEVTIGPYEVYEDRLFGAKAAFEAFITVRDPVESAKLEKLSGYMGDLERALPIPDEWKNFDRGLESPLLVVDLIYSAGDTRAGVQTLAFNLPNDERVRQLKGSKKVLLKNMSHAKFDGILTPIAARVMAPEQLAEVTFDAYFNHTLLHEISHGLGPGFIGSGETRTTVNQALRERYPVIEEAKADVLGVVNTLLLAARGELPAELQRTCPITFLAGIFRSVRFGAHEAHGQANLIALNYLLEAGAFRQGPDGRFGVDLDIAPGAFTRLATELLTLEARGDYEGAGQFIERYGHLPEKIVQLLATLEDIPVDIRPLFELDED